LRTHIQFTFFLLPPTGNAKGTDGSVPFALLVAYSVVRYVWLDFTSAMKNKERILIARCKAS